MRATADPIIGNSREHPQGKILLRFIATRYAWSQAAGCGVRAIALCTVDQSRQST
jgi:hypothetical protein